MTKLRVFALGCCFIFVLATTASAAGIYGDYIETRSADVYTGPCIANSEAGLGGDQAIVAWRIKEGSWNGVKLDGLSVVGVAKANATLGDPFRNPYPAKSVLLVDAQANAEQLFALQSFAQSMAQDLLKNIVRVETVPISMLIGEGDMHGSAKLEAGSLARVETRSLGGKDHLCGNEEVYYQPLTNLSHAMAVYTMKDEFNGSGLGVNWKVNDKRSAFVGTFSQETSLAVK